MTFTSFTFLIFLSLVFSLYWILQTRKLQNILIVLASYTFYGWWDWRFCFLMFASSTVDFLLGFQIYRTSSPKARKAMLFLSLIFNLGLLGFFKYFNFFAENLNALAFSLGVQIDPFTLSVILPVGISFYTFQTLSYTIDIYQRRLHATTSFIDYLSFVSFFPQLVAGPIERAPNLLGQFLKPRTFSGEAAQDGLRQILVGLFKKMVLADNLAVIVDIIYGQPEQYSGSVLMLGTVYFAFQIYYDFSGYSDIAIGTARLFDIHLMRNFAYPYFSQNVAEFWRRWHISLSTWFRDYVYIPLGGNQRGKPQQIRNIMLTFIVSGFWHGADWTFGVWGAISGALVIPSLCFNSRQKNVSELPGSNGLLPGPIALVRMITTFTLICITWIFFRSTSLVEALGILRSISMDFWQSDNYRYMFTFLDSDPYYWPVFVTLVGFILLEWFCRQHDHVLEKMDVALPLRWLIYTGFIVSILTLGTRTSGTFIYFQF